MYILIAEDDEPLAEALAEILKGEGHFIEIVGDGSSLLSYASAFNYDLLIVDVMMPGMDGFEAVRRFRQKHYNTPVLMLTARASVDDKVKGLNAGADDYMTKPFDTRELLARVRAMTRRTGDVILDILNYADLKLDLNSAVLSCGDSSIQLSRKEFDVIRFLMTNPTMTVPKESLIVNIWGMDSDVTENNVEAYISFLRKKIRYLGSNVNIRNLQKIGYRLEAN